MRLHEIMHADPMARKPKPKWLYGLLAAALIPVAAAQFAWAQGDTPGVAVTLSVMPVDAPITSGFGKRQDPFNGQQAFHNGVDFTVPAGTPVRAPASGTVSSAGTEGKYGLVVELDHGGGLKTRFAHLDTAGVKSGERVTAGEVIGTAGNTGQSTGAHLHFEVWKEGKVVDPATMLPKAAG